MPHFVYENPSKRVFKQNKFFSTDKRCDRKAGRIDRPGLIYGSHVASNETQYKSFDRMNQSDQPLNETYLRKVDDRAIGMFNKR